MIKILLGMLIGIAALVAFLYFGGPEYLKAFGRGAESAGEKLEVYEKRLHESAKGVKEAAGKTADKTKDAVKKTIDR